MIFAYFFFVAIMFVSLFVWIKLSFAFVVLNVWKIKTGDDFEFNY